MKNNPKRSVHGNELKSSSLPKIRIQIDPSLNYIGNLKAVVLDNSEIDSYYFIDKTTEGQIQRILYFQFEAALPSSDKTYEYPHMQVIDLGEQAFGYDGGVRQFRQTKIDEQANNSDVRQTVDFLSDNQVQFIEGDFYGMLRFAKVLDDSRRNDLLIIYLERLEEADIPEDVVAKSRYSEEWSDYCKQLLARAVRTFNICKD